MEEELDKHQIGKVYVVGIALDYCVFYSAMDSQKLGKYFFRYGCKTLPDFISSNPYGVGSLRTPWVGWCEPNHFILENFTSSLF